MPRFGIPEALGRRDGDVVGVPCTLRSLSSQVSDRLAIMPLFASWMQVTELQGAPERVRVLREIDERRDTELANIGATIADHLVNPDLLERLEAIGYEHTAEVVRDRLPTTKRGRSADLGEVFATEFIDELTNFAVPIRRLRYKDHPDMALRGADVVGFRDIDGTVSLLKAEAKARERLTPAVVEEAIESLNKNFGRPASSTISFIASRLVEQQRDDEWEIVFATIAYGVEDGHLHHLVFTLSGNDPSAPLRDPTPGEFSREFAGVHVVRYPEFRREVFEVIDDTFG